MTFGNESRARFHPLQRPTSILLYGPAGPLLDWVAWAVVHTAPGGYHWTDVRSRDQGPNPSGPVERGAIPPTLLNVRNPEELAPDHAAANAGITAGVRAGDGRSQLERIEGFLRLPRTTQALISSARPDGPPLVLVVSNGQRLLPTYTADAVRSALRTILSSGIALLDVFEGVPSDDRALFENVWRLSASQARGWREASLEVERAVPHGPIPALGTLKLGAVPLVADALNGPLDPMI